MDYRTQTAATRQVPGFVAVMTTPGLLVMDRLFRANGEVVRYRVILADPGWHEPVRLGDHYHPANLHEHFSVLQGSVESYIVPHGKREHEGHAYRLSQGDDLTVHGLDAHTFILQPGSVMVDHTGWELTQGRQFERAIDICQMAHLLR